MQSVNQPEKTETAQRALVYVGVAVSVVVVLVLLWYAIDVVFLAFIGVLLAILLRAPSGWLARRSGLSEGWSLALVGALLAALLVGASALFGRVVALQSMELTDRIPEILEGLRVKLQQNELGARVLELVEASGAFSGGETSFLGRGLGLIGSTFGALANLIIVLFFGVFLAVQPGVYVDGALHMIAKKKRARVRETLYAIGQVLRRWLVAQSLIALLVTLVVGAGLLALGAPFALPLALLAGLMEFVPYIGPLVAAVPAVVVGLGESPQLAGWIALLYLGVQLLESYLLAPLVQHRAVDLPPAMVIFSQVLMGVVVGGLGVAVATPLAAAALVAVNMLYVQDVLGEKPERPRRA
jgi:predicted PurR-regulated permease PerM